MEKSGSRVTEHRELIIESPSILRLKDRFAEVGITLFFWMLMLYLWQPVFSLLGWLFQGYAFYHHMMDLGGYQAFGDIALTYVWLIILIDGTFLIWARINQLRFRGVERRKQVADTSLLEHALYCNVDARDVERWREYRQMVVTFGDDGYISGATPEPLASFRGVVTNKTGEQ